MEAVDTVGLICMSDKNHVAAWDVDREIVSF